MPKPKLMPFLRFVRQGNCLRVHAPDESVWEATGKSVDDLVRLAPYLDGLHSPSEAAEVAGLGEDLVRQIVNYLSELGLVVDVPDVDPSVLELLSQPGMAAQAEFLSSGNPTAGPEAMQRLMSATVMVIGQSSWTSTIVSGLRSSGVGSVDSSTAVPENTLSDLNLLVVVDDGHESANLRQVDSLCRQRRIPWLRVSPEQSELSIGPLFVPEETACYRCYEARRFTNVPQPEYGVALVRDRLPVSTASRTPYGAAGFLVSGLVALATVKFLAGSIPCEFIGQEYTLNVLTLESDLRPLLAVPTCPTCVASRRPPEALITRLEVDEVDSHREQSTVPD